MAKNIMRLLLSGFMLGFSWLFAQEQYYMQQAKGPEGIWARQIVVDPANGNLFLCAQDGSYYLSRDQGANWVFKSKRTFNSEPMIVTDWGVLFIGESRIYKSDDQALTWQESNSGMPSSTSILSFLYDKSNGEIYAGTDNKGIYVSQDSGATWIARNNGLTDFASTRVTSLYRHGNGEIYATTTNYSNGHIFRWDKTNQEWNDLSGSITGVRSFTDLAVTPDNRIFVTTWSGLLYRSDDGGVTWNNYSSGINDPYMSCITALPGNVVLVGTLYNGVYRSENFGASWIQLQGTGLYGSNAADVTYDYVQGYAYIAMRNAGIFRSDAAGNTWQVMNNGLRHVSIDAMVINENEAIFAAGWGSGVYRSNDKGDTWQWIAEDFAKQSVLALASKQGYLFAGTQADGVYASTDEGDSWSPTALVTSSGWIVAMTIGYGGSVFAGNTQGILYRSSDNGGTWDELYDFNDEIMDIIYNPYSNHLFVAIDDFSYGGVYRSKDNGTTWIKENINLGSVRILSLAVLPGDSSVYASTADDGIYLSDGSLQSMQWEKPPSVGLSNWIQTVAVSKRGEIFAGGNLLYRSRDNGLSYEVASPEPSSTGMMAMVFDKSEFLYIGTDEKSVWRSVFPTTARNVRFSVKMKYEDGFESSSQQVEVHGLFNDWGTEEGWTLSGEEDEDLTYSGTFTLANVQDIIVDGRLDYKYAIPPDKRELFSGYRSVEWEGTNDLYLEAVWYSNQKEFSRMTTTGINIDQSDTRGCAWGDFNNDGNEDLFVTHAGNTVTNDLYLNNGDGKFNKITTEPIISDAADSRAAVWGDYNNDGWLDLYVCNTDQNNFLYKNDGNGNFVRADGSAMTVNGGNSVSALWADFDQDGFLDLFVANNSEEINFLYKNNGDETFSTISGVNVVTDATSSLGCSAADFDNDGDMDLFVANFTSDFGGAANFLYRNEGNWSFTKINSGPLATDRDNSSGGSWGDVNNDGWPDLLVTNVNNQPNRLYLNDKSGGFLSAATDEMTADSTTSLGSTWMDYNNDGWLDLFVSNGGVQRNTLYLNDGDGNLTQTIYGPVVQDPATDSRAAAWADYDLDGDADLFLAKSNQPDALYRNNLNGNNWLKIKVEGPLANSTVVGTTVIVKTKLVNEDGSMLLQRRTVDAQSGLMGQNSPVLQFGMRQETNVDSIIIIWPDGLIEKKISYPTNQILTFRKKMAPAKVILNNPKDSAVNVPVPPTLAWNQAEQANKYWIQVAESISFSPLVAEDSALSLTSLVLDEAAYSKTYYWKVRAGNEIGWGEWSIVWKFTTGSAASPPPAPVLSGPANGATNITLPPTLTWSQAGNANQYYLQVSSDNSYSDENLVADDSSIAALSYTLTALSYNTTYFWHVQARNTVGWGDWSEDRSFTTVPLTSKPDSPIPEDPPNGQTKMAIPALLSWTSNASGAFTVVVATDQSMISTIYSQTVTENYIFVNTGLNYNTTYYWHVKVTINATDSDWSSVFSFTTYDDQVQVTNKVINFPSHTRRDEFKSEDYILLGLPGNADKLLGDVVGAGAGETWIAYWDNGASGTPKDYFVPYDGTARFKMRSGIGYWLIHNGPLTINETVPIAPLNQDAKAEISIHQNFNIITCPFDVAIDWDEVRWANELDSNFKLWWYNSVTNSFETSARFEPFKAYYIFNETAARTILQVPYIYPQPVVTKPAKKNPTESAMIWQIQLVMQSGETTDHSTRLGIAADAKTGLDRYEYRKPRGPGKTPGIYFNRPEWDKDYSIFAADFRPEISGIGVWDFQVSLTEGEQAAISLEDISKIPETYDVYLIDKTHQLYQNLRQEDIYRFNAAPNKSDFELVVGETAAIEEKLKSVMPQTFSLGQNYPNPFNPTTTIPFTLPEQTEITLKLYNLLGQEIALLFNGTLNAGKHYFNWDGKNMHQQQMPSGIYIYQIRVQNGERLTGKMVLIK